MTVLGINVENVGGNDSLATLQAFIAQGGLTFPIVADASQTFFAWGEGPTISPFPLDVVIDRQGVIRYFSREYSGAELEAAVQAAK